MSRQVLNQAAGVVERTAKTRLEMTVTEWWYSDGKGEKDSSEWRGNSKGISFGNWLTYICKKYLSTKRDHARQIQDRNWIWIGGCFTGHRYIEQVAFRNQFLNCHFQLWPWKSCIWIPTQSPKYESWADLHDVYVYNQNTIMPNSINLPPI